MKTDPSKLILNHLSASASTKVMMFKQVAPVTALAEDIVKTLKRGKKLLIFGNGGSAADAQHFAAELVVKYKDPRPALAAIALTTDSSVTTATGNDYGFDFVFSRQIEALGCKGDMAIGFSTSGKSENVRRALRQAIAQKMTTVAFTGKQGIMLYTRPNHVIAVPSEITAHIQETHIALIHAICTYIDSQLAPHAVDSRK